MGIRKIFSLLLLAFLCCYGGVAQTVPTSYEAAKEIGDAKYKTLTKANAPAEVRYVVLKRGCKLEKLVKYENAVYVVDKVYNLKGKTLVVPNNSVLVFRKGNIKNGVLLGDSTKYTIIGEKKIACRLDGTWEMIAPIYTASELGLRPVKQSESEYNYKKLQTAIGRGLNIFLDGTYYVSFSKPITLNYELHIFGGKLFFSKHGFDLTNNGGLYANGVHFSSIPESKTDDIVCGTREKHDAITTGPISFQNCLFSCNRVVSLMFKFADPTIKQFGIQSLLVRNCFADQTAKFIVLDSPFLDYCEFFGNSFTNFSHAPIYFTPSHSTRTHPEEQDTNPWTEEIVQTSCPVIIESNVFIGKEVIDPSYYCAALVVGNKCSFLNNYLRDIVNYSDKSATGYTAYDAYLSCVDVEYDNNYIENMISYSKDGASKPQNEIGKSKMNPLSPFNIKATRSYVNNIFICDGNHYLAKGVDPSSMTISLFCNVSPIDTYIWENNSIIYKGITLDGRHSSAKYGSFLLKNNYFECADLTGYLVFQNSANDCSGITIQNNVFKTENNSQVVIFNQLYKDTYSHYKQGEITISDNVFHNAVPVYHLFAADRVGIKRNRVDNAALARNTYLSNYTGINTPLAIREMDADIILDTKGQSNGAVHQFFSSESSGSYFLSMKDIPAMGIYFTYQVSKDHSFQYVLQNDELQHFWGFEIKCGIVSFTHGCHLEVVRFGSTKPTVISLPSGGKVTISFEKGNPNRIIAALSGHSESDIQFGYIGK